MKYILASTVALLLLSGCVSTTPTPTPLQTHSFAGGKLVASPQVSNLVQEIEALSQYNTMSINLDSNQNVKIGQALNISVNPSQSGYLKIVVINPKGQKELVIENSLHNGYLKANRKFSTTNKKFSLRAFNPKGLHYVVTVFSQDNSHLDTNNLLSELQEISRGKYLNHAISIYPMRVY